MTEPFRPLDDLPKAQRRTDGVPPDADSRFGRLLVDAWYEAATHDKPNAVKGARFRHSDAAACARAVAYAALKIPAVPPDAASNFPMELGTRIHDWWQEALQAKYGDHAEIEVKVGEGDMGGHIDAVVKLDSGNTRPHIIAVELKSIGGSEYKIAIGDRGPAKGPRHSALVQAALNGKAVDADEIVIVYLSRDAVSIQLARSKGLPAIQRVTSEWTRTREQYMPLAEKETWRVGQIISMVDEGTLPARIIPDPELLSKAPAGGHVLITNPVESEWSAVDSEGSLVDAGRTWQCFYCRYQDTCAKTGAHREPVDVLVKLGVLGKEADDDERDSRGQ